MIDANSSVKKHHLASIIILDTYNFCTFVDILAPSTEPDEGKPAAENASSEATSAPNQQQQLLPSGGGGISASTIGQEIATRQLLIDNLVLSQQQQQQGLVFASPATASGVPGPGAAADTSTSNVGAAAISNHSNMLASLNPADMSISLVVNNAAGGVPAPAAAAAAAASVSHSQQQHVPVPGNNSSSPSIDNLAAAVTVPLDASAAANGMWTLQQDSTTAGVNNSSSSLSDQQLAMWRQLFQSQGMPQAASAGGMLVGAPQGSLWFGAAAPVAATGATTSGAYASNMNADLQRASSSLNRQSNERLTSSTLANANNIDLNSAAFSPSGQVKLAGRRPVTLYMPCDDESLSPYQCLVRQQIELFEANQQDVDSNAKGRNKPIVLGQVGVRCRHCAYLPPKARARGAMYYPGQLDGLYQAAQSLSSAHLCKHCQHIPPIIRQQLLKLKERKSSAGGGKLYWGEGVRILGVYETEDGLRFKKK